MNGCHNTPLPDGYCGEIAVEWAAETPLLVGGAGDEDGVAGPLDFDARGYWIPGASFRGMIRSAAEIIGYARLEQVNRDHVFALRDFEHPCYNDPMKTDGPKLGSAADVRIGWLSRQSDQWTIEESRLAYVGIDELLASGFVGKGVDAAGWRRMSLDAKYASARMKAGGLIDFRRTFAFGPSLPDAQRRTRVIPIKNGGISGTLVFSGPTPKPGMNQAPADIERLAKKVEYVALDPPGTRAPVTLSKNSRRRFELVHTKQGANERLPDGSWAALEPTARNHPIPVFFTGDLRVQGEDFAFGLTRLFRVPHRYTVGEILARQRAHDIADSLQPYEPDLVSALFGYVHEAADVGRGDNGDESDLALKGRVAFSGARIEASDRQRPIVDEAPIETVTMAPRASFARSISRARSRTGATRTRGSPDANATCRGFPRPSPTRRWPKYASTCKIRLPG